MKLSVVIPVFNEEKTLERLVAAVRKAPLPAGFTKELIIINDASTDGTSEILATLKKTPDVTVIEHMANQGKGASVKDGFIASTGDVVIIQDADLEYNPDEYSLLLEPIVSGDADVVFGSRFMGDRPHRVLYYWHFLGNSVLTLASNMLTNVNISDMETCYKMLTRKVVDDIKHKLVSKRFGIEPELTARVKRYRIYEVGISYHGRTYSEGKKIGWKDGISAMWAILRFNLFS